MARGSVADERRPDATSPEAPVDAEEQAGQRGLALRRREAAQWALDVEHREAAEGRPAGHVRADPVLGGEVADGDEVVQGDVGHDAGTSPATATSASIARSATRSTSASRSAKWR